MLAVMVEIHNPPNLELPPLKMNQGSDRQSFEANQEVKTLISSNLLLDAAFSAIYMDLFAKTKELRQLIELATVAEYSPWPQVVKQQGPQLSDFLPTPAIATYTISSVQQSQRCFGGYSKKLRKNKLPRLAKQSGRKS